MPPQPEGRRFSIALLGAALALGAATRVAFLARPTLWVDEAYSVHLARLDAAALVRNLGLECTPPLYYLLLRGWIALFGDGEWAVRGLSVLFGLTAVAAAWAFARSFLSPCIAALVALLAAFCPLHVYYSQQARMYALVSLLTLALAGCALAFVRTRSRRALVGVSLSSLALLLTHNVCLWLVIGFTVAIAVVVAEREPIRRLALAQAGAVLAYLPWLLIVARQLRAQSNVLDWFVPVWQAKSPVLHLLDTLWCFSVGPFPNYLALGPSLGESWLVRVAFVGLVAVGVVQTRKLPAVKLVGVAAAVALTCAVVYSVIVQPVHIPGRTDIGLLPFFLLLLAAGLAALPTRAAPWIGATLYAALALAVLVPYYRDPSRDTSRVLADALRSRLRAGDAVLVTGLTYAEIEYALRARVPAVPLEAFPASAREHPGYLSWRELLEEQKALRAEARELVPRLARRVAPDGRLLVVWVGHPANTPLIEELLASLTLVEDTGGAFRQSITGAELRLLVWSPKPAPRP